MHNTLINSFQILRVLYLIKLFCFHHLMPLSLLTHISYGKYLVASFLYPLDHCLCLKKYKSSLVFKITIFFLILSFYVFYISHHCPFLSHFVFTKFKAIEDCIFSAKLKTFAEHKIYTCKAVKSFKTYSLSIIHNYFHFHIACLS